ncbi:formylglycine-generating enzyme family protein [Rhizobium alvei]|uniref:Formylglycine-generating enzyme family protein n=1 Tax=Rhizobium alvei TaxID=1132659 RepID=A0ABT8YUJ4_9HYPH|nr:formylglycine-generating enzyme family protein [Rhizobium alvei]MDO6967115.1 formylglycine-generating enzyme family protein [Rhizobium alvei]
MTVTHKNALGMEFTWVEPGEFLMGSPTEEAGREGDESQHHVVLTKGYFLQNTTVTNEQYRKFKPSHSSGDLGGVDLNGDDQPVVNVSWTEAAEFLDWLSSEDGHYQYRMPTEAEWEFAARAGSQGIYWWGNDHCLLREHANVYDKSAGNRFPHLPRDFYEFDDGFAATSPVGSFKPNPWGFYDMIGNVWEMCQNWAYKYPTVPGTTRTDPDGPEDGSFKTCRGGDFLAMVLFARLANRTWTRVEERTNSQGFRALCVEREFATAGSAKEKDVGCLPRIAVGSPTWEGDVKHFFNSTDITEMRSVSQTWRLPMDLADYDNVKYYGTKIYSAVRGENASMPMAPSPKWPLERQAAFLQWVLNGCPRGS